MAGADASWRMRAAVWMVFVGVLAVCAGGRAVSTNKDVVELSTRGFRKQVAQSNAPWMVVFYRPSCPHCHKMLPAWNKMGTRLARIGIRSGRVNTETETDLASKYKIRGVPTVMFFAPRLPADKLRLKDDETPGIALRKRPEHTEFAGERTARGMARFALQSLPEVVQKIRTAEKFDMFFGAPGRHEHGALATHALLVSEGGDPKPLWRVLGAHYGTKYRFGYASRKVAGKAGLERVDVLRGSGLRAPLKAVLEETSGPVILLARVGAEGVVEATMYEGVLSHAALEAFLVESLGTHKTKFWLPAS